MSDPVHPAALGEGSSMNVHQEVCKYLGADHRLVRIVAIKVDFKVDGDPGADSISGAEVTLVLNSTPELAEVVARVEAAG
jgi:hypothetical protein